jgi:two-component system, OmpR family, sensor histidine kinase CreC
VNKRNRIFFAVLLIYLLGTAVLMYRLIADLDPRYRESAEEALVETSHLMASLIEQDIRDGAISVDRLPGAFKELYGRRFSAQIFSLEKTRVELRVYVTDSQGAVLFDSLGKSAGQNFSRWRDVHRALKGQYGARTTPDVEGDASTAVMFVAAPITYQGNIIGCVSVGKPEQAFGQFIQASRQKMITVGVGSAIAVLVFALLVSAWLVRPFGTITDYVRYVRAERSFSLPRLGARAWGALGAAYDEMRDALAGRNYVADYVQTLTHEVKSPLSAIRGAAELLQEPMADAERQRFLGNITRETGRIQELVDRMMELTALEARKRLDKPEPVALRALLQEQVSASADAARKRNIAVELHAAEDATVLGDAFLLRRAVANLLDNAIDFSPDGGVVVVSLEAKARSAQITVQDAGPGIPDYAEDKVFEKFYSLARPHSNKKSTGLGLAFVKEIAALHGGKASLQNAAPVAGRGGCLARLSLPA